MSRRVVLLVALACAGCGAGATTARVHPPAADDAVELAALLPDEVERCVVARPGQVTERRRGLVLLHSLAEPSAWASDLRPVAYATAVAERPDGRRARRTYYRFADEASERARDALPSVRWIDEPCEGPHCDRSVARWIDERTLEVARYGWPRGDEAIVAGACVRLARAHPEAVEVALDRASTLGAIPLGSPRPSEWVVHATRAGVTRRREVVMRDPLAARLLADRIGERGFVDHHLVPMGLEGSWVEADGERIRIVEARSWETLELAVEDEQLRVRASVLEARRGAPVPVGLVRVADLGAVRHQLRLRRAQLERLGPAERERVAAELGALLARAWDAHPSELGLAESLVRLYLDTLGDPTRARAVVAEVIDRGLASPAERWRLLEREAAARLGAVELAELLASEGVPESEGLQLAEDLRRLIDQGVPYEWAEGAWRASRELAEGRASRRLEVRLPFEGVLGALVGWARLQEPGRPMAIHLLVRSSAGAALRPVGDLQPPLVPLRAPGGGMLVVGALASPDLLALRRVGAALADLVPPGPVELVVALGDPAGPRGAPMRLSGTRSGGVFAVERVSPELVGAPWALFARYLAQPLAELSTMLFPAPTLTVRTESEEMAAALRRAVEEDHPDACRTAGPVLRCQRSGWPEELGAILLRLAEARRSVGEEVGVTPRP